MTDALPGTQQTVTKPWRKNIPALVTVYNKRHKTYLTAHDTHTTRADLCEW